jgi:hypothetical protein
MGVILTPRNTWDYLRVDIGGESVYIYCRVEFYNVFLGMHQTRTNRPNVVRVAPSLSDLDNLLLSPYYLEESLDSLWEKDRLLIVQRQDYENDTAFGPSVFKQNLVNLHLLIHHNYLDLIRNQQIVVTFDIEPVRDTKAQLFLGSEYIKTFDVTERRKATVVYDPIERAVFNLRPALNEMYFYSVKIDVP